LADKANELDKLDVADEANVTYKAVAANKAFAAVASDVSINSLTPKSVPAGAKKGLTKCHSNETV
jgi:hypothetical protein